MNPVQADILYILTTRDTTFEMLKNCCTVSWQVRGIVSKKCAEGDLAFKVNKSYQQHLVPYSWSLSSRLWEHWTGLSCCEVAELSHNHLSISPSTHLKGLLSSHCVPISDVFSLLSKCWHFMLITPGFYSVLLCHQATAPFLHIGALATVTAVSWLVAGYVIRRERSSKCWPVVQVKVHVITRTDLRFRFLRLTQGGEDRRRAFLYDCASAALSVPDQTAQLYLFMSARGYFLYLCGILQVLNDMCPIHFQVFFCVCMNFPVLAYYRKEFIKSANQHRQS